MSHTNCDFVYWNPSFRFITWWYYLTNHSSILSTKQWNFSFFYSDLREVDLFWAVIVERMVAVKITWYFFSFDVDFVLSVHVSCELWCNCRKYESVVYSSRIPVPNLVPKPLWLKGKVRLGIHLMLQSYRAVRSFANYRSNFIKR